MSSVYQYEQHILDALDRTYRILSDTEQRYMDSKLSDLDFAGAYQHASPTGFIDGLMRSPVVVQIDAVMSKISDIKSRLAENKDKLDLLQKKAIENQKSRGAGVIDMAALGSTLSIGMILKEIVRGAFKIALLPFSSKQAFLSTAVVGASVYGLSTMSPETKAAWLAEAGELLKGSLKLAAPSLYQGALAVGGLVAGLLGLKWLGQRVSTWWNNRGFRKLRNERLSLTLEAERTAKEGMILANVVSREMKADALPLPAKPLIEKPSVDSPAMLNLYLGLLKASMENNQATVEPRETKDSLKRVEKMGYGA